MQELANVGWENHSILPLHPSIAAPGVAEGTWPRDDAAGWAAKYGVDGARFDRIVETERTAPAVSELRELWRRGEIDVTGFEHGLRKLRLETRWDAGLKALKEQLLSPADLANARQQGFIDITRQRSEAQLQGIDNERADIMFELSGLPPGIETALQMLRRNIIGPAEFAQIVREGHTKTKYTDELLKLETKLTSGAEWAELWLRGWVTETEAKAGGAREGWDAVAMDNFYHARGRPATTHQAFIGVRRGGVYNGPTAGIPDYFIKAVRQSNIRNEWLNILWAQRYTLPSAFVLRALTQGGDLTQAESETTLLHIGWPPDLAVSVSTRWAGGVAATTSAVVKSYQGRELTRLHAAYLRNDVDDATAEGLMAQLGVDAADTAALVAVWQVGRGVPGTGLTPAQIKKAYKALPLEWTRPRAIAELEDHGYAADEAATYLDS